MFLQLAAENPKIARVRDTGAATPMDWDLPHREDPPQMAPHRPPPLKLPDERIGVAGRAYTLLLRKQHGSNLPAAQRCTTRARVGEGCTSR